MVNKHLATSFSGQIYCRTVWVGASVFSYTQSDWGSACYTLEMLTFCQYLSQGSQKACWYNIKIIV